MNANRARLYSYKLVLIIFSIFSPWIAICLHFEHQSIDFNIIRGRFYDAYFSARSFPHERRIGGLFLSKIPKKNRPLKLFIVLPSYPNGLHPPTDLETKRIKSDHVTMGKWRNKNTAFCRVTILSSRLALFGNHCATKRVQCVCVIHTQMKYAPCTRAATSINKCEKK